MQQRFLIRNDLWHAACLLEWILRVRVSHEACLLEWILRLRVSHEACLLEWILRVRLLARVLDRRLGCTTSWAHAEPITISCNHLHIALALAVHMDSMAFAVHMNSMNPGGVALLTCYVF